MPYAFSSGWFPAHSETSRRILEYLLWHGGRLLGVPRTYARTVYGDAPGAGLAQVYGLGISRFLSDNDQPDQLDLSLYGMLAAGMTAGTYVSGEAVSLLPLNRTFGNVTYSLVRSGPTVDGELVLPPHAHTRLRLRLPVGERLVRVLVGRTRVAAGRAGTIDLGNRHGTIELQATVR